MAAICVYCASSTQAPASVVDLAAAVGAEIARRGHTLVSGGGSVSAMGAVARAVRAGGGHTVGVIPEALVAAEVADRDADELVVTADMRSRKAAMDARADGFLALPGGIGTLEELFEVWVARSLGLHDKPVVVLDPDGVYDGLRAQLATLADLRLVRAAALSQLSWTTDVSAALDAAGGAAGSGPGPAPTAVEAVEAEPG